MRRESGVSLVNPCDEGAWSVSLVNPYDEGAGEFHQLIPVMGELVCFNS